MIAGIPKETHPDERRVATVPTVIPSLLKAGLEVRVERGAGESAGFTDDAYVAAGAKIEPSRDELFRAADILLQVQAVGSNPEHGKPDLVRLRAGQIAIGFFEPYINPDMVREMARRKVSQFAMELVPRITRAQSMDALSSMATISGYKAVLMAADHLPKMFPMLMTAAGTLTPAKVLIMGVGVAGLQAIATARRLGALVSGYDIRPVVKEQVESLGAKFVELDVKADGAEDKGGYAKEMSADFIRRQQAALAKVVAEHDVVITTALIPGKRAPILLTRAMIEAMSPGSMVVDLAAERGGNSELTRPGETVLHKGVQILGPVNLPSMVPFHASQMYAKNVATLLLYLVKKGAIELKLDDEIVREMLCTHDGIVVQPRLREMLGEAPLAPAPGVAK